MSESARAPLPAHTLRERLSGYIGRYLTTGLLLGISHLETREGILSDVGAGYFVLRDPDSGMETLCDLYTLKFVSAYPAGMRPCALPPAAQPQMLPAAVSEEDTFSTTPQDGGQLIATSPQGLFRKLERDDRLVLPCPTCGE